MSNKPESEIKQDAKSKQDSSFSTLNFNNQKIEAPKIILKSLDTGQVSKLISEKNNSNAQQKKDVKE